MRKNRFPLTERITGSGQALMAFKADISDLFARLPHLREISCGGSSVRRIIITFFLVFFAISLGDIAMAQTKDEIETRNKAVVQASFDAWKAGTGSPYDLLADDASAGPSSVIRRHRRPIPARRPS